jgi:hypothetical protein
LDLPIDYFNPANPFRDVYAIREDEEPELPRFEDVEFRTLPIQPKSDPRNRDDSMVTKSVSFGEYLLAIMRSEPRYRNNDPFDVMSAYDDPFDESSAHDYPFGRLRTPSPTSSEEGRRLLDEHVVRAAEALAPGKAPLLKALLHPTKWFSKLNPKQTGYIQIEATPEQDLEPDPEPAGVSESSRRNKENKKSKQTEESPTQNPEPKQVFESSRRDEGKEKARQIEQLLAQSRELEQVQESSGHDKGKGKSRQTEDSPQQNSEPEQVQGSGGRDKGQENSRQVQPERLWQMILRPFMGESLFQDSEPEQEPEQVQGSGGQDKG